ncbi:MAG: ABC transporter ATP-binding protein [Spirochaetia bacterium]
MSDSAAKQAPPPDDGPEMDAPGFMDPTGGRGPAEKPKDAKKTIRFLMTYFRPLMGKLTLVYVFSASSAIFAIVGPKLMGNVTTKLFDGLKSKYIAAFTHKPMPSVDFNYIGGTLLLIVGFYLLSSLFRYLEEYILAGVSQGIVYQMKKDVNEKLARLPLKYFDSKTHGEIMSRMTNDTDNISNTLRESLGKLISNICTIIGVLMMMLTISPLLTLIALVTLPISILATTNIIKRSQKIFGVQQKELGELNGHVEEMYSGNIIVKAFGNEEASVREFKDINARFFDAAWKAQFISGVVLPIMNFVTNIGYVAICVVGGILAARKVLKLGDIQAFIMYSKLFTQPISETAGIANVLQSTLASAERIREIMEEEEQVPERVDAISVANPRGQVDFRHVSFGYKENAILIKDMSITVEPGQTIAIVGPTGAGKTTLVNLLMRFYEISGGAILVDGVDTRDMKRHELRRMFGMVLQDTWLFNGTIRENIAYGRDGATEEDVVAAARAAHADHFIRALPEGYGTVLNEEASNISQGEKQLITIARAILANNAILILDEATSSVDTRTEAYIQKAMKELIEGRTSFVIAHRLSTIRDAESILVMKDGSIIEMGRHDELLARGGFYADLYNSQFTGAYVDEQGVKR